MEERIISDKHLYHVVSMLPSPNMVTDLVTKSEESEEGKS